MLGNLLLRCQDAILVEALFLWTVFILVILIDALLL
jgi:hypothetical protein